MVNVLLAGLYHETHAFLDQRTTAEDFTMLHGDEVFAHRGSKSQLAGFIDAADERGWSIVPSAYYSATPSGIVDDAVVESFWDVVDRTVARTVHIDAVFLVFHGAMATERYDDVEGEILERLRCLPRLAAVPIFGGFDLHATFTPKMASLASCLVCYRNNPHTDAFETGRRAADLLHRSLTQGVVPTMTSISVPIIWSPLGTATSETPMRNLESLARSLEAKDEDIWAINVVAGFAYADAEDAGVSFSIASHGSKDRAREKLRLLAELAGRLRGDGMVHEVEVADAVAELQNLPEGPVLFVEASDNIGAGAPGDGTGLLRALIEDTELPTLLTIADSDAVTSLFGRPIGSTCRLNVGGKGSKFDAGPVALDVEVVSHSHGSYRLSDPSSHLAASRGNVIQMGRCCVVRHRHIHLLLTSIKSPPWDLGQLHSQGLRPENFRIIGVKSAVAHRQAYRQVVVASFLVRTPGPCPNDLSTLPYRRLKRPIFPIDETQSLNRG